MTEKGIYAALESEFRIVLSVRLDTAGRRLESANTRLTRIVYYLHTVVTCSHT